MKLGTKLIDLLPVIYQKDNVIEYEEISISETKPIKLI